MAPPFSLSSSQNPLWSKAISRALGIRSANVSFSSSIPSELSPMAKDPSSRFRSATKPLPSGFEVHRSHLHNDTVDCLEFRSEIRKIMLAIADGLGSSPIQMVLEETVQDNLLQKAADLEASKLAQASS